MSDYSCNSQTMKEGSESILTVAIPFGARLYHRPSAETMSTAKGREVQPSFERALPTPQLSKLNHVKKMYQVLKQQSTREPGDEATLS